MPVRRTFHERAFAGIDLLAIVLLLAIVAILVWLFFPLISRVNGGRPIARHAQLTAIATACESYHLTFEEYPGYFSDTDFLDPTFRADFSSTENLVVSLMGRVKDTRAAATPYVPAGVPASFEGKAIDLDDVGAGPQDSDDRIYGAFYSPRAGELGLVQGTGGNQDMWELLDRKTGVPILYYRNTGGRIPVSDERRGTTIAGAYHRLANQQYTDASTLATFDGEIYDQASKSLIGPAGGSNANNNLAWLIAHPTLSNLSDGPNGSNDVVGGGFVLISAGEDGIYFSIDQNDGNTSIANPDALTAFDDYVIHGGNN